MQYINEFCDDRLKGRCAQCGVSLSSTVTNQDHIPTKSILQKPYPQNLPTLTICKECNSSFSLNEQYFVTFLSCILSGTTEPEDQILKSAAGALKRSAKLRKQIELSKSSRLTEGGKELILWKPDPKKIEQVVLKNARAHIFYETAELAPQTPQSIWFAPFECLSTEERDQFETIYTNGVVPELGSRLMQRSFTFQDFLNGWIEVQENVYRYALECFGDEIRIRSVIHNYLATEVRWSYE